MDKVNQDLKGLMGQLEQFITTKTVVGEPIHIDNTILVPLVDVSFGAAAGGAATNKFTERRKEREKHVDGGSDAGAGGVGAKITPSAMLVIQNGTTQLINIRSQDSLTKLIDMIPGFVAKAPDFVSRFTGGKNEVATVDEEDESADYHKMEK